MSTVCTRCEGTGFLNTHQLPDNDDVEWSTEEIHKWVDSNDNHDVQICDCCGDGDGWYGAAGEHYNPEDMQGPNGVYVYNGGLCECH